MSALAAEVDNPRTWETQYHMIMALADCGCFEALPLLRSIICAKVEHMVLVALATPSDA